MEWSDLRSPISRASRAVLSSDDIPWLNGLQTALENEGFVVERASADKIAYATFISGAGLVVINPDPAISVAEIWLRMCERAPKSMPVIAVHASDRHQEWLAAGFDEVFDETISSEALVQRLMGRLKSRSVHHSLASTDPLTGLVTQQIFFSRLDPTVRLASRAGMPMSVAVIDLDGFVDLEARRGRDLARMVLKDVANHLQAALRRSDTISRLGDDRFGLILHQINAFEARRLLYKLWRSVSLRAETMEILGEADSRVTFTAGIAVFPGDSGDARELYTRAELALDTARATGHRRVLLYSETCGEVGVRPGASDLRYHRRAEGEPRDVE